MLIDGDDDVIILIYGMYDDIFLGIVSSIRIIIIFC